MEIAIFAVGIRARDVDMKRDVGKESLCDFRFRQAGECWHLWTDENHPLVFASSTDFEAVMDIIGMSARLFPELKLYTFELMSNHIHAVVSGNEDRVKALFKAFRHLLSNYFRGGKSGLNARDVCLDNFNCNLRLITTVSDFRNVIAYDNRNGFVVSPDVTPFSYPWGANRYFFNPDARQLALESSEMFTVRDRLRIVHSHVADSIPPLKTLHGYACPMDFCAIEEAESLFLNASQYFNLVSRPVESFRDIAREISERIFYTDDELYSAVCSIARKNYGLKISELGKEAKTELARAMHYDYNASNRQISRMLRIQLAVVDGWFV